MTLCVFFLPLAFNAWSASAGHEANQLDSDMNTVGMGFVYAWNSAGWYDLYAYTEFGVVTEHTASVQDALTKTADKTYAPTVVNADTLVNFKGNTPVVSYNELATRTANAVLALNEAKQAVSAAQATLDSTNATLSAAKATVKDAQAAADKAHAQAANDATAAANAKQAVADVQAKLATAKDNLKSAQDQLAADKVAATAAQAKLDKIMADNQEVLAAVTAARIANDAAQAKAQKAGTVSGSNGSAAGTNGTNGTFVNGVTTGADSSVNGTAANLSADVASTKAGRPVSDAEQAAIAKAMNKDLTKTDAQQAGVGAKLVASALALFGLVGAAKRRKH